MWEIWAWVTFAWRGDHRSTNWRPLITTKVLQVVSPSQAVSAAHFHTLSSPFPSPVKNNPSHPIWNCRTSFLENNLPRSLNLRQTYKCYYNKIITSMHSMIHGLNTNLKINIVNYKMSAWKISYSLKYFLNGQKMTLKQPRGIPGSNLLPFSEKKKNIPISQYLSGRSPLLQWSNIQR